MATFNYKPLSRSLNFLQFDYSIWNSTNTGMIPQVAKYSFNYNGATTTVTDPKGYVYSYSHNGTGQCTSATKPLCAMNPSYQYRSDHPTTFSYDSNYNLLTISQKKRVYTESADSDPIDIVTEYQYDTNGNVKKITQDLGTGRKNLETFITYETTPRRDVLTDITSIKDPRGNTTTYTNEYNATTGKLTKLTITPPQDDYTIVYEFNDKGQRISKDVKLNGQTQSKYHFAYAWYGNGLLKSLTNSAAGTTTYYYTVYGERKSTLDANGVTFSSDIDPRTGNIISVPPPTGPVQFAAYNPIEKRSIYSYDVNGNKLMEKDAKNHLTKYHYDALNHLNWVESPEVAAGHYNSYNWYDLNGNLTQTQDYNGKSTVYQYDELNRKKKTINAAGIIEEELIYDEAGRVKVKWDGKRNKTEFYYDSVDNIVCTKYYEGEIFKAKSSYVYDKNGNVTEKNTPISSLTAGENFQPIITSYQYDAANRPTTITVNCSYNSKYNQTTGYTYEAGQLKTMSVSVAGGSTETYTYDYDPAQRLDTLKRNRGTILGEKVKFDYLPGGQRIRKRVYKLSSDLETNHFINVDYKYDVAYRLLNLDYTWGSSYVKSKRKTLHT